MRVLLLDNFDSFTWNLWHLLAMAGRDMEIHTDVIRNNEITPEEILKQNYKAIIISPGPGEPKDAGISVNLVKQVRGKIPLFGVCLGHQAIGEAFNGKIIRAPSPMHGKTSEISHNGEGIFANCAENLITTRYHSLIIDPHSLSNDLKITARSDRNEIMGIENENDRIFGVQFHPESIATQNGTTLLQNFLHIAAR